MEFVFANDNTELTSCKNPTDIVIVPMGVTKIMPHAFKNSNNVRKIILPSTIKFLSRQSFEECPNLEFVEVSSKHNSFGCSYCKCSNLNNIISQDQLLIKVPASITGTFVIPQYITQISEGCFCGCNKITDIIFPSHINAIGRLAFSKCSALTKVTIPKSVTIIEESAFRECQNLKIVLLPNTLSKLSANLFEDCTNLENVYVYDNNDCICELSDALHMKDMVFSKINVLEGNPFARCYNLSEIIHNQILYSPLIVNGICHVPDGVIKIASHAFENKKNLQKVFLPDGLEIIESYAFKNCSNLTHIIIPKSVKHIGNCAFDGCSSLRKIDIETPAQLLEIGFLAFNECVSLKAIIIPKGVTEIKIRTFKNCRNLKHVTLPYTISKINTSAFWGCKNLESVNMSKKWDQYREQLGLPPAINQSAASYSFYDNYELGLSPDGPMKCTEGSINPCPYCGHYGTSPYTDGTARCNDCRRWFKYTQHWF